MADVSIDATISTATARGCRSVVFTTDLIGYVFYLDSDGVFGYSKTTDGGATWGAQVNVDSVGATTVVAFDVWFDKWTPGITGTLIHTAWFDVTNDIIRYRTLDTNGDTFGTTVSTNQSSAVAGRGAFVSLTRLRSGDVRIAFDIDAGAERGLLASGGDPVVGFGTQSTTFVEATLDTCLLFPAPGTNDLWALYYDASALALTLKQYASNDVVTESATIGVAHTDGATDLTGQFGYSAALRHSDGHLIVAALSGRDVAASTHQVFDITSTSSIATKTAIAASTDDHYYPQVFIDQNTDAIYVAYNGKRDGSEVLDTTTKVYYAKSTDGGATWTSGDTAYMEGTAGVVQQVWVPLSGPRFYAVWRVGTTLVGNKVNSVVMTAATGQAVTGVTIGSTATLNVPVVANAAAAQAVTGTTLSSGAQVTPPTVAPGAVTLIGATVTTTQQVFAATVAAGAVTVTAATIPTTAIVRVPSVALGAVTITGGTVPSASVVRVPTVAPGAVTVVGATIATAAQVTQPTVAAGAVAITGATIAPTAQVFAPTLGVTVALPVRASTAQLFAATLATGAVPVTTGTIATAAQVFAPSLTTGASAVTGATIGSTAQVFAVTVTTGAITITGATVTTAGQTFAPSLTTGANAVLGGTIGSTALVFAATVTPGAVTVTGATRTTTLQLFAPIVLPAGIAVTGATRPTTAQLFAPTLTVGPVTINIAFKASTAQVFVPSLVGGLVTIPVPMIAATSLLRAPTVTVGAITVEGATIDSTVALFPGRVQPIAPGRPAIVDLPASADTTVELSASVSAAIVVDASYVPLVRLTSSATGTVALEASWAPVPPTMIGSASEQPTIGDLPTSADVTVTLQGSVDAVVRVEASYTPVVSLQSSATSIVALTATWAELSTLTGSVDRWPSRAT